MPRAFNVGLDMDSRNQLSAKWAECEGGCVIRDEKLYKTLQKYISAIKTNVECVSMQKFRLIVKEMSKKRNNNSKLSCFVFADKSRLL